MGCWIIDYVPRKAHFVLIPSVSSTASHGLDLDWYSRDLFVSCFFASQLAASILQLDFNKRSRTFAGDYAINARAKLVVKMIELLYYVQPVVGVVSTRASLSLVDIERAGACALAAWQSSTLSRVEQTITDDEEE